MRLCYGSNAFPLVPLHSGAIFQSFKLLHIDSMYKSHVDKYMFMRMNHMLPESLLQTYSQIKMNSFIHIKHAKLQISTENTHAAIEWPIVFYILDLYTGQVFQQKSKTRIMNFNSNAVTNNIYFNLHCPHNYLTEVMSPK